MINFKTYTLLENLTKKDPKSNTLHAFDMDETLFAHDHEKIKVHVVKDGKVTQSLTNQEFNTYKLKDGESFDFKDFKSVDIFKQSAKPIRALIAKMRAINKNNKNVEILTARADMDNQKEFANYMKKFGIDIGNIHVRRAGNLNAPNPGVAKAAVISQLIKANNYTKVHLYDDSASNLKYFASLKTRFPAVEFNAHLVQIKNGSASIVSTKF